MSGSSTTLTNSNNDLPRDTQATSVVLDGCSDAVWVREWRNGGIEVRDLGAEQSYQLSIPLFSSLLLSSPYFVTSLDLGPV